MLRVLCPSSALLCDGTATLRWCPWLTHRGQVNAVLPQEGLYAAGGPRVTAEWSPTDLISGLGFFLWTFLVKASIDQLPHGSRSVALCFGRARWRGVCVSDILSSATAWGTFLTRHRHTCVVVPLSIGSCFWPCCFFIYRLSCAAGAWEMIGRTVFQNGKNNKSDMTSLTRKWEALPKPWRKIPSIKASVRHHMTRIFCIIHLFNLCLWCVLVLVFVFVFMWCVCVCVC